jgi:SagB-type dehydrogenase family enzyme
MSKLAWVLLPLLLIVAGLAVAAWRQRAPRHLGLNVLFSMLLLAYLLSTAGLGIFWVANQHLPVFDWHYLFGYVTLLLVVVHLAFNFRVVWRYFIQPRAPMASDAAPNTGRRSTAGWLTAIGVAGAAGLGYGLGLRHGRTELTVASGGGAEAATNLAVVERFHAFSTHTRGGVLRRAAGGSWGDAPPPFKLMAVSAERLALPDPALSVSEPAWSIATLGALLWHVSGVSARRGPIAFRTSPSSGALFSTELYVVVLDVKGLAAGVWHYESEHNGLARLRPDLPMLDAWLGPAVAANAAACIVATAVFGRSGHKYRDRTYRYVLADLGHALENLRVAAEALGGSARLLPQFDEARIDADLQLASQDESTLAVALLAANVMKGSMKVDVSGSWQATPVAADDTTPLALTSAVHRATSLRHAAGAAGAVPRPALPAAVAASAAPEPADALQLPPATGRPSGVLQLIASRRSIRRFAATPLSLQALSEVLHAMTRWQTPLLSQAVRIDVVTPAVQGLAPRAWRYDSTTHRLQRRRPAAVAQQALRTQSRRAALDQDVIGDAAAVFVWSIDRAAWATDPSGAARGYRHAFLETGLQGERLYLAAGALGLGVCAVGAFYDEEVSTLVGLDAEREWVVHFAALGVPA